MSGWKKWAYGDLVSTELFQGNVQDQVVQKYANSDARNAALGTAVAEGMVSYLTNTNSLELYDGSTWSPVASNGSGNAIINGALDIWQRGSSFSLLTGTGYYSADRWDTYGATGDTLTRQTFTPGSAPVSGYEGTYFARLTTSTGSANRRFAQRIEDVRSFAGQTVTFSFWAKSPSGTASFIIRVGDQNYGTGGSSFNYGSALVQDITDTWTRYSLTATVPSIAGKTIGTNSYMSVGIETANINKIIDVWGFQLEAGASLTPFRRNAPSVQGELAACQRYYWRQTADATNLYKVFGQGSAASTSAIELTIPLPVTMRTTPTSVDFATPVRASDGLGTVSVTAVTLANTQCGEGTVLISATTSGATQFRPYKMQANNSATAYLGFSAEL